MAQAYRTLVRDENDQLRVVLREVGSDAVISDPSGYTIVKLDEGQNPIPVNYWLDRPVDFSTALPSPQTAQSVDGLNPGDNKPSGAFTAGEDRGSPDIDYFNRNEGRSSDTPTPQRDNAYNADGTPNRLGEGIIDRGRGFLGAAAGAAIGGALGGPIGALAGGLAARAGNSMLNGSVGDRISPAGQLYGWGIGQPKPEAAIAEIDRDRQRQAAASQPSRPTSQAQARASGPVSQSVDGLNPSRSAVPSFDTLMSTPVSTSSGARPTQVASLGSGVQSVGRSSAGTQLEDITGKANISYQLDEKNRPHRPDLELTDRVRTAVGTSLPGYGVTVTSGLGEFGSDRHRAVNGGRALDFTLTDPSGRTVTPTTHPAEFQEAASALASYGVKGIGHYGWGMHADTVRQNSWGPTQGLASLNPSFGNAIERGRANPAAYSYSGAPTPTSRPDPTAQPNTAVASSTGTRADFSTMSMGELAFSGYGQRPDDTQIEAMSRVMAGELSPQSLQGLRAGDPQARREAANIVATMENRRQSVGFGNVTNPSQYNSMMGSNLRTTDANYGKFGSVISDTIRETYAGRNPPSNPNATHYANMDIASPSWGRSLTNVERVGPHTFGTIPGEYRTSQDRLSQARQAAEASRRAYEDSRATPAQDVSPRTASSNPSSGISPGGFASLGFTGGPAGRTQADAEKETNRSKDTSSTAERNDRDNKGTKSSSSNNTSSDRGGSGLGGRDSTPSGRNSTGSSSGGLGSRSSGGVTPGAERSGSSLSSSSSSSKSSSKDNDKDKDKGKSSSNSSKGSSRGGRDTA